MQAKPRTARGIALLTMSVAALAAAMALAIPALAHHGGNDHFGSDDPAGMIASFDAGTKVLTIDLADGGSISGLVTRWTWIDDGDDHGDHHWGARGSSDDLIPGAVVDDAVLALGDGRAFFAKVDLDD